MDVSRPRGPSHSLVFGQPNLDVLDECLVCSCALLGLLLPVLGSPQLGLLEFALLLLLQALRVLRVTLEPVDLMVVLPKLAGS